MTRRQQNEPNTIEEAFERGTIMSGEPDIEPDDIAGPVRRKDEVVGEVNDEFAFVLMGSKAVVLREMSEADAPTHDLVRVLSLEAFSAYLANRSCYVQGYEKKHGKLVPVPQFVKVAPLWLTSKSRRTFEGVEFYPDPNNEPGRRRYFNLWRGFSVEPDRTTPKKQRWRKYQTFRDHLFTNICSGDRAHFDWLFAWFAWIVQRPRNRLATSVVLRGEQGTGKTVAGEVIGSLFPSHYFLVDDPRYLVGQFNAHLASCILLQVDEGFWAGDKTAEGRLKGLISSKNQMIESKGIDPIRVENRVNVMFSSNESWVVPAGMSERRHAVFDVAPHALQNHTYFEDLWKELDNGGREALLADLLDYDLDAPGAGNPRVIPKTGGLLEQKIRSFDPVTSWWYGRLVEGSQTHRATSWRSHIPTATLFNDYLRTAERIGIRRRAAETEFGMRLRELVPAIRIKRRVEDVEDIGDDGRPTTVRRQVRCYDFPELQDCRFHFEQMLQQVVAWEDDGEASAGESARVPPENAYGTEADEAPF